MARKQQAQRQDDETPIDMTPMLDIVFIMLIFFIVTATFVKEAGQDVTRPEAVTAVQQDRVSILVAVTEDEQIWINREETDLRSVRAKIEKLHAENPQGTVVIKADEKAPSGLVLQVSKAVQAAGVGRVGVATENEG